jgi:hypothetical protein
MRRKNAEAQDPFLAVDSLAAMGHGNEVGKEGRGIGNIA